MRDFSTSVDITASAPLVWRVLADVDQWADWTGSIRRIERLDALPLKVGSRVRIEQPKMRSAVWTVTEWEPTVGFGWVSKGPGFLVTASHAIEPTANGSKVTLNVHFDGPLASVVGALASRLTCRYLGLEAAGLKARCERAR
jgi:uncharacterized protein YndB with AHSA1/START domain